jgi:hypothetical protein
MPDSVKQLIPTRYTMVDGALPDTCPRDREGHNLHRRGAATCKTAATVCQIMPMRTRSNSHKVLLALYLLF